jgi:hypothetical protein
MKLHPRTSYRAPIRLQPRERRAHNALPAICRRPAAAGGQRQRFADRKLGVGERPISKHAAAAGLIYGSAALCARGGSGAGKRVLSAVSSSVLRIAWPVLRAESRASDVIWADQPARTAIPG